MTYIDPIEASPNEYKLLLDSDKARVIEMKLPAGTTDTEHSHPHEFVYFIKGGKVRIHVGEEQMELDIPDGHTMQHKAWTHRVENIGDTDIYAILFELKE